MTTLRPMTQSEYAAWLAAAIPAYAADKVASGQWSEVASLELSAKDHAELLPHGLETPENYLYIIDQDSDSVGVLWFAVRTKFNSRIAHVFNIEVHPECRRRGHATRAFLALESEVARLGLSGIALHVFGHNQAARAMYAKLGYEPTNINLFKRVSSSLGQQAAAEDAFKATRL